MMGKPPQHPLTRFLRFIHINTETGCWDWTGYIKPNGYGHFRDWPRKAAYSHRAAFRLFRGEIPAGLDLDHLCRNRACANPWHLEPVTRRENLRRGSDPRLNGTYEYICKRGHIRTDANTRLTSRGHKQCQDCRRLLDRARA